MKRIFTNQRSKLPRVRLTPAVMALLVAALALPAAAAEAQPLTPCPACGAGWLLEPAAVQLDRTTTEKAPCAHGDPAATDYTQTVRYQPMQACSHCGYAVAGEVYTAVETSCSLDFAPVPRPAAQAAAPYQAPELNLQQDLYAQAQQAGLAAGQFMIGEHNRTLYLVQYTPVVADYAAWGGAALTPQECGGYTWQAGSESAAALQWSETPEMAVTARALHDFEQGAAGDVPGRTLPQATVCASYGRGGAVYFTLSLSRAAVQPGGKVLNADGVDLYARYGADGEVHTLTWYDPESGLAAELQQVRISEQGAAAWLAGYVQQNAEALRDWAAQA